MTCPVQVKEHTTNWNERGRWGLDTVAGWVCKECRQARHCMMYGHDWQPSPGLGGELACTWCHLVQCMTPREAW